MTWRVFSKKWWSFKRAEYVPLENEPTTLVFQIKYIFLLNVLYFYYTRSFWIRNFDSNFILRLYEENLMLKFLEIETNNPKLTQKQLTEELGTLDSTIKI